jgi:hypothetical protein
MTTNEPQRDLTETPSTTLGGFEEAGSIEPGVADDATGQAPAQTDPETEAMLAGAEIEKGADEGRESQDQAEPQPLLTTDPEAQEADSVINPETG